MSHARAAPGRRSIPSQKFFATRRRRGLEFGKRASLAVTHHEFRIGSRIYRLEARITQPGRRSSPHSSVSERPNHSQQVARRQRAWVLRGSPVRWLSRGAAGFRPSFLGRGRVAGRLDPRTRGGIRDRISNRLILPVHHARRRDASLAGEGSASSCAGGRGRST